MNFTSRAFPVLAGLILVSSINYAQSAPTVLADLDHRASVTLNGEWHFMTDPYQGGLYSFHRELRRNGYFLNAAPQFGSNELVEYDFSKSPTLKVPGDWNTQREQLFYYEGLIWYQREFEFSPATGHRTFLHIGAANYRSMVWINGKHICDHEGGFTGFDCEATQPLHAGKNFIVIAVDNTRLADGVPTLNTDWWNYGGITRDVALVDVPERFIDQYDLHLNRSRTAIEGWVHVENAAPGATVTVALPDAALSVTAAVEADGRAKIALPAASLELWSPGHPKLYRVLLTSGGDKLEDEMGFRTIETDGTRILLNGKPIFLRGISIHAEAPYPRRPRQQRQRRCHFAGMGARAGLQLRSPGPLSTRRAHDPGLRSPGAPGVVGDSGLLGRTFRRS